MVGWGANVMGGDFGIGGGAEGQWYWKCRINYNHDMNSKLKEFKF